MTLKQTLKKTKTYKLGLANIHMARKMTALRNEILGPHGMTSVEWFILGTVQEETPMGGIRVTDLATLFDVKTTYITATVHALRSKGYVSTKQDPGDARVRLVVTTQKGNDTAAILEEKIQAATEALLRDLVNDDDFKTYVRVVQQVAQPSV